MMDPSRRWFLVRSAASVGLGFAGLRTLEGTIAQASGRLPEPLRGFGPLRRDPAGILDLPDGFTYRVIARRGAEMADGLLVPGQPDGMAAFPGPDGTTLLVCNHELDPRWTPHGPFGAGNERLDRIDRTKAFDVNGSSPSLGGTTTIQYDPRSGDAVAQWMSLAGTNRNCAGGPTPWGSWLTCEEDEQTPGDPGEHAHGWVFEVPATAQRTLHRAEPLRAMGRFYHEAVAVDATTGIVYQTEDRQDACFYRFLPKTPGVLRDGGRLQALRVIGSDGAFDTRNWDPTPGVRVGESLRVEWVDLDNVEAPEDDLRRRAQRDHRCAVFARTEGIWATRDEVYIGCTSGGHRKIGQIWTYRPSPHEGTARERDRPATLQLFIEPNDPSLVENADNLVAAPWGDLIVCEDGTGEDRLVGVTPSGGLYPLARNAASDSEFAGVCFSPDGSTMFVNLQSDGLTVAVRGPWDRLGRVD